MIPPRLSLFRFSSAVAFSALLLGPSGALAEASCEGDASQVVGRVVAMNGSVHAQRAGEEPRTLSCNDVVHACETVITSGDSRVGVLASSDVYAHLETDSQLQIGQSGDLPTLALHAGGVRVVDTRSEGAPGIPFSTPHLATETGKADTEFWVSSTGTQEPTGPTIDVGNAPSCELQAAAFFTPLDVAAPPFGFEVFPDILAANDFRRGACEVGGACGADPTPIPPVVPPRGGPRPTPSVLLDLDPDGGCGPGVPCEEPEYNY
ncbi:MAG: hypothetical protein CL910_16165 [Deltaproteobacteria bacterium]|nr:hypothetical protein [Deltaproteobacteria bacterium]